MITFSTYYIQNQSGDFFNTIGMPTSTTVSIVFELLGASVAMALIKIGVDNGSFSDVVNYINTSKATQIIGGIFIHYFCGIFFASLIKLLEMFEDELIRWEP